MTKDEKVEMDKLLNETDKKCIKYCDTRIYAVDHSLFTIMGDFEDILATEILNAYSEGVREGLRLAQAELKKKMKKEDGK